MDVTTLPPLPKRRRPSILGDLEKSVMARLRVSVVVCSYTWYSHSNAVMSSTSPEKLAAENGGMVEFRDQLAYTAPH